MSDPMSHLVPLLEFNHSRGSDPLSVLCHGRILFVQKERKPPDKLEASQETAQRFRA